MADRLWIPVSLAVVVLGALAITLVLKGDGTAAVTIAALITPGALQLQKREKSADDGGKS